MALAMSKPFMTRLHHKVQPIDGRQTETGPIAAAQSAANLLYLRRRKQISNANANQNVRRAAEEENK